MHMEIYDLLKLKIFARLFLRLLLAQSPNFGKFKVKCNEIYQISVVGFIS